MPYLIFYYIAFIGHACIQFLQSIHSVDKTFCPFLIYFRTSISIGHFSLHFPQSIHLFPVGFIFANEKRVNNFITSETGQNILQKARFFLNTNARIIPIT